MYVLVDFYSRHFVGTRPQTMVSAACPSPNDPLGNGSVPRYFRGTFHLCMGTMPMLFTWHGLLVWTQQETTITLDNRGVLLGRCAPHHGSLNSQLTLRIMSQYFAYIFKPCMWTMPACFMPHMHLLVWKSQIGAKTLVNMDAGKKLTCFDLLRKGCRDFF